MGILPIDQRRAIELAYFEGLNIAEIAARLNRAPRTIRRRLRLGLEQLAGTL